MVRDEVVGAYHRGTAEGTMLATIIDDVSNIFHNVWNWFQTLTPGGFGLILIPLIILGTITILVSRNR
jgi:hypothetical protein